MAPKDLNDPLGRLNLEARAAPKRAWLPPPADQRGKQLLENLDNNMHARTFLARVKPRSHRLREVSF
jgi:hypothetical protein